MQQVGAGDSPFIEFQRRDAKALLENLVGPRVVTAVGSSPDIAVVCPVDAVEEQATLVEDRTDDGDVREVATAEIRVVQDEQVPSEMLSPK